MREWATRQDVATAYDAVADAYTDQFADELDAKPYDRALLDNIARRTAGGLVADVGCGPGHVARYLAGRGVRTVGVELSFGMLVAARRLVPTATLVQGDMCALPFASESVDAVVAFYSVIHLRRDELPQALREMRRSLRPGGLLVLAFHRGTDDVHLDEWFGKPVRLDAAFHEAEPTASLVRDAGFTIQTCDERAPYEAESTHRVYIVAGA